MVRLRDGSAEVTDGPYLETKEDVASHYLLDCQDEQRALQIAARMPWASFREVEAWPVLHEGAADM